VLFHQGYPAARPRSIMLCALAQAPLLFRTLRTRDLPTSRKTHIIATQNLHSVLMFSTGGFTVFNRQNVPEDDAHSDTSGDDDVHGLYDGRRSLRVKILELYRSCALPSDLANKRA
jgi:hypothetical protein